jgi:methyl-accepting chemotaxis protein-1 (serine sensor receptor)
MKTASLQFKVLVIVAAAMGVSLLISVGALTRLYGSLQELDRVAREDFDTQQGILRTEVNFKTQVQEWKNLLLRGKTSADFDRHWKAFEEQEKKTQTLARESLATAPDEEVRKLIEQFLDQHKRAAEGYRKGMEAFKAANFDDSVGDKAVAGIDRGPAQTLVAAEKTANELGAKRVADAVKGAETAYRVAIVIILLAMLAALVALWYFVRRAVLQPLDEAAAHAERIAQGDLSAEIRSRTNDEAGQLLRALGRMSGGLSEVVMKVRQSAESVVTASNQVAAGTTDLSQRTEEQASSLEETAASMEELASTVKQNADNARQADELARTASKRAEQGGTEVVRVVVTMNEISDSASKIADIISVIDGIAFQTNILALNAAVEAARAGEQGRGFAVVASEVRALAQRSAQAAKEIKDLIGESVQKVDTGTKLVEQAGETIQSLVIDVKQVSDLMRQIAEASAEQSRGVQQVNKTVTEMDKVVQQNASAVQESASAAEAMRQQAESLVRAVSIFRLSRETGAAAPARPVEMPREFALATAGGGSTALTPAAARSAPVARGTEDDWEQF